MIMPIKYEPNIILNKNTTMKATKDKIQMTPYFSTFISIASPSIFWIFKYFYLIINFSLGFLI